MKRKSLLFCILIFGAMELMSQQINFSNFSGPYFGQKPPGLNPEIFAPELTSISGGFTFSSEGNEIFFLSVSGIVFMKQENKRWTEPQIASFSGKYRDFDFNFSPDGSKLLFTSNRPPEKDGKAKIDMDIWYVNRTENGWSEPQNIGFPINTELNEVCPSISENGNLYFFRSSKDSTGFIQEIYCSKFINNKYTIPEKLGDEVNSGSQSLDPFIAPDESYLIFHSFRQGEFGGIDLYISFRNKDGIWSKAINMGDKINSAGNDSRGRVSNDGKYFFFNRRDPQTRIRNRYWVDAKIIDELKAKK